MPHRVSAWSRSAASAVPSRLLQRRAVTRAFCAPPRPMHTARAARRAGLSSDNQDENARVGRLPPRERRRRAARGRRKGVARPQSAGRGEVRGASRPVSWRVPGCCTNPFFQCLMTKYR